MHAIVITVLIVGAFVTAVIFPDQPSAVFSAIFLVLLGLYALATFIPGISVAVRRLHDFDQTGWWYLGIFIAGLVFGPLAAIAQIVIGCIEGTNDANRFGRDPLGNSLVSVF